MGLLNNAGEWLGQMLQTAGGVSVTYTRVADQSTPAVTPWVGASAQQLEADRAKRVQWGDRDYILRASELVDGSGDQVKPQKGDRLTETIDGTVYVFEVQSAPGSASGWRWVDETTRTMIRLHVKKVG